MNKTDIRLDILIAIGLLAFVLMFFTGCGSNAKSKPVTSSKKSSSTTKSESSKSIETTAKSENNEKKLNGAMIEIKQNSAADTVRVFYDRLREKKFRDAILLTNLRPAIEGMTDDELNELGVDFGFLAQSVPEKLPINGEVVTGNDATVMVKMEDEEDASIKVQEIKLRKEKDNWIVLVADKDGEKAAKKEGKNFFFTMRMNVHHEEAKTMLTRINKAQMIYRMKNEGRFTDLQTLVKKGYVPPDALGSITTGYKYNVALKEGNTLYTALATPAEYGKTGKLSFAYKVTRDKQPELVIKDVGGKSLIN